MKNPFITLIIALLAGALSACVSSQGIDTTASINQAPERLDSVQTPLGPWPHEKWWQVFNDPQLDALMTEALHTSPTLEQAGARIRQATALAAQVRSGYAPQGSVQGDTIYQRFTENGAVGAQYAGATDSDSRLGFNLAYDLDLWGRKKADYRAALGSARVAEVEAQAARLALTCAIAETYVELRWVCTQAALQEQMLEQERLIEELRRLRADAGLDSKDDRLRSASQNALTRARLEALAEHQTLLQHRLGTLAGAGPQRGLELVPPAANVQLTLTLPAEIPAQLIGRRPDVVAQLWRINAMRHAIASARAAFYPDVNLAAFAGFTAIGLDNLLHSGSRVYGVGPALSLPLFTGGRLQSALAASNAAYDSAVEHYNALVLTAVQEVADAVTTWQACAHQLSKRRDALAHMEALRHLSELKYRHGLSTRMAVLDADAQILAEQSAQTELRQCQDLALIALIKAVGGGLRPQPPADTPEPKTTKG